MDNFGEQLRFKTEAANEKANEEGKRIAQENDWPTFQRTMSERAEDGDQHATYVIVQGIYLTTNERLVSETRADTLAEIARAAGLQANVQVSNTQIFVRACW